MCEISKRVFIKNYKKLVGEVLLGKGPPLGRPMGIRLPLRVAIDKLLAKQGMDVLSCKQGIERCSLQVQPSSRKVGCGCFSP